MLNQSNDYIPLDSIELVRNGLGEPAYVSREMCATFEPGGAVKRSHRDEQGMLVVDEMRVDEFSLAGVRCRIDIAGIPPPDTPD